MGFNIVSDNGGVIDEKTRKIAARAFEVEEGKTVLVDIDKDHAIRADYRCMDKDSDICEGCGLRFTCYSSTWLLLKQKDLHFEDIGQTLNEKVEAFITSKKPKKPAEQTEKPDSMEAEIMKTLSANGLRGFTFAKGDG